MDLERPESASVRTRTAVGRKQGGTGLVEAKPTLTLAELGHDADRDRPTHLFPPGYDNTIPQVARCGTLIHPPFHPRREAYVGDPDLCLVCVEISLWWSEMDDRLEGS